MIPVQENTEHVQSELQVQGEYPIHSEAVEENSLEQEEMSIWMKIGDEPVAVAWEDNESARGLKELLREQPLSIQMSMYGDFEQVGSEGLQINPPGNWRNCWETAM